MISLPELAALWNEYAAEGSHATAPFRIGPRHFGGHPAGTSTDPAEVFPPAVMGTINLSRDSTYRESIAVSVDSAIRKARIQVAQGADFVDIGAESSTARATRVDAATQTSALLPVLEGLAAEGIAASVESYYPEVIEPALRAGAALINYTGRVDDPAVFALAAEHDVPIIMCYVAGENVRDITDVTVDADPIPALLDHFGPRIDAARAAGVTSLAIDPGMGFYYGNLVQPQVRVRHQARVILHTFRLRQLGLPICHAMPHAFDLFEDHFRVAEGFFTVLAQLGGADIYRTHEVPHTRAVLGAMQMLQVGWQD